jgi:hypothetical protein
MVNDEELFESEKTVEDYAMDLEECEKILAIEPDKFPEGQPMENVVEVIEKPISKKPEKKVVEKKKEPESTLKVESKLEPERVEIPIQEPIKEVTLQTPSFPVEQKPVEQPVQTQQSIRFSIDDYITTTGKRIGVEAEKNFLDNAYGNLLGVIRGDYVMVPKEMLQQQEAPQIQQPQQPAPQPEPQEQQVIDDTSKLRRIELELQKPNLDAELKIRLLKMKHNILGLPFDEISVLTSQQSSPVSSKVVKDKKVKSPEKMWNMKIVAAFIVLSLVVGAAIVIFNTILTG